MFRFFVWMGTHWAGVVIAVVVVAAMSMAQDGGLVLLFFLAGTAGAVLARGRSGSGE